jgi:hypothetical protein
VCKSSSSATIEAEARHPPTRNIYRGCPLRHDQNCSQQSSPTLETQPKINRAWNANRTAIPATFFFLLHLGRGAKQVLIRNHHKGHKLDPMQRFTHHPFLGSCDSDGVLMSFLSCAQDFIVCTPLLPLPLFALNLSRRLAMWSISICFFF